MKVRYFSLGIKDRKAPKTYFNSAHLLERHIVNLGRYRIGPTSKGCCTEKNHPIFVYDDGKAQSPRHNFFSQDQGITFSKDITAEEDENSVLYYYYTLFKYIVFNFRWCAKWDLGYGKHSEPTRESWVQPQRPTHLELFAA